LVVSNGHSSATGYLINLIIGSRVGFSGSADRTTLLMMGLNPIWWLMAILKISNGFISATGENDANDARGVYMRLAQSKAFLVCFDIDHFPEWK